MSSSFNFEIKTRLSSTLARTGEIHTPNGVIKTPAFIPVGTKGSVKALTPEMLVELGAQAILANTYHLYFQPGDDIIADSGGLHSFMNWQKPIVTDSGGFQVFSLGSGLEGGVSKIGDQKNSEPRTSRSSSVRITEEGVTFTSLRDGSLHTFTPEKSIDIQHNLRADIFFAFDECTSPYADHDYQQKAAERTHRWADRCIKRHSSNKTASKQQMLFGVVQGGRFEDLRRWSAKELAGMPFSGFGIGGSFEKEDIDTAVRFVTEELPEDKPRHLLGIGTPVDIFKAVENGIDMFDCVSPTRAGRNGSLYTLDGPMNIKNASFKRDLSPIDPDCHCYVCSNYSRAYLCHLFRSKEMLASTLGTYHNLYFIVSMVQKIRRSLEEGSFFEYKDNFLERYYNKR